MKKPRKQQSTMDRVRQRAIKSKALPQSQQYAAYYCAGRPLQDFTSAIVEGDTTAISWALDVVQTEQPLYPNSGARYIYHIHTALRKACAGHKLNDSHKRRLEDIEIRTLQRLLLRAYHSHPSPAQERAVQRLAVQRELLKTQFGTSADAFYPEYDEWPATEAPAKLILRVFKKAQLTSTLAARFIESSYNLLMDVYHAPDTLFPDSMKIHELPHSYASKLCYFFCRETEPIAEWVIAPLSELEGLCGFIIAADGSFFYNADEWNSGYGAILN
ncbi:MAG: hypothetical protein IJB64_05840 [Akkermansia sp.]|nr:hypothetical protein [Akkermansia sp.]